MLNTSNSWIQTHKGHKFFPYKNTSIVDIRDIAHSLSLLCRFNGHCKQFYSVAQHSVLVASACGEGKEHDTPPFGVENRYLELAKWGLLHDAMEAYLGDTPSPLKSDEREFLELSLLNNIGAKLGLKELPFEGKKVIANNDKRMLVTEKRDLMAVDIPWGDWTTSYEPFKFTIHPLGPEEAEKLFLSRFDELFDLMDLLDVY